MQGIAQQVVGSITPTSTLTKAMQWHLAETWQQVGASHKGSPRRGPAGAAVKPDAPKQCQARLPLWAAAGCCRRERSDAESPCRLGSPGGIPRFLPGQRQVKCLAPAPAHQFKGLGRFQARFNLSWVAASQVL